MAVKSDIQFKGFQVAQSYVTYVGHSVRKTTSTINGVKIPGYLVFVQINVFRNSAKDILLIEDEIGYSTDSDSELSFAKIWKEVKSKYPGTDVL